MAKYLKDFLSKVRLYVQITRVDEIARRYFVMNGFDGSMTTLGVILGSWILGNSDPRLVVMTGLGACFAMGVSGFFGSYMAERAESRRRLKMLEESLLSNLNDSLYEDASRFASLFAALINGLSSILTAIISLIPFLLVILNLLIIWDAYLISFAVTFAVLFLLGTYLGRIAEENVLVYGVEMLAAGAVISIIIFLLGAI